ncbi:RimK family alpha-L-glutamate ligase [Planctomycetota bacterium]
MNILILSRRKNYYATRRLCQAARRLRHKIEVLDPFKCTIALATRAPRVYCGNKELRGIDAVIPRPAVLGLDHILAVIRQFELQKVPVINNTQAIAIAKNKLGCLQVLAGAGLPLPSTIMSKSAQELEGFINELGGTPVVVKLLQGGKGTGVFLTETYPAARSAVEATLAVGLNPMLQQYIPESKGQDIRMLVVGERVIAAMRRYSGKNDFRSNVHCGGHAEKIKLSDSYKRLAIRAARVLGLQIAGVDVIESKRGPMIIEVNTSPGFQELERVTKLDIATAIIKFVVKYARSQR